MTFRNRIHYRNSFLHIGHFQTIFYNNDLAKNNGGTCCVIVDDRQDANRTKEMQDHFNYLKADCTKIISVARYIQPIMIYTKDLVESNQVFMTYTDPDWNSWEPSYPRNNQEIYDQLDEPTRNFQLKLKVRGYRTPAPTIGYTTRKNNGQLIFIFLFDYIIKVLDHLLEITDIVTTSQTDITDMYIGRFFEDKLNINYTILPTYRIDGFKYSKQNWPSLAENDPRLLTLPGLKARHVPAQVLYSFYLHAMQMGEVKISYLDNLLRSYLNYKSSRVFGVLDPIKVNVANWVPHTTEFICKPKYPSGIITDDKECNLYLSPLSDSIYIERSDFGFHDKNNIYRNGEIRLKYGPVIACTDIEIDENKISTIKVDYSNKNSKANFCIHWVSSEYGDEPIKVRYYLYNWFYTGLNNLTGVKVKEGYIENEPFNDLSQIYQLERIGYFVYDQQLSAVEGIPCFVRICGIKN